MEESKKKEIELKWRRLIEAANLDSNKPAKAARKTVPSEVKVIRRRKRRVVNSAA